MLGYYSCFDVIVKNLLHVLIWRILILSVSGIEKMTEKSPASSVHTADQQSTGSLESTANAESHAFVADQNSWSEQQQETQQQLLEHKQVPQVAENAADKSSRQSAESNADVSDGPAASETEADRHKITAND